MCVWTIQAPADKVIELIVDFVEMEHHPNCSFDYLRVYERGQTSEESVNICFSTDLSTHKEYNYTSTSNALTIVFRSDVSITGRGFHARYLIKPESELQSSERDIQCYTVHTIGY